jgi:tRNA (guanine37-N1)-methyltransferase
MTRLLRKAAEGLGEPEATGVQTGIDVIGDLAIVKFSRVPPAMRERVGEKILHEMKNVKGVFEQEGGIEGEYRLRKLRHLAGERRTTTLHKENGCRFLVDIAKVYYSPRLSTERLTVSMMVREGEKVLNMFAGVGPFSITIARRRRASVTSCESNKDAYRLHLENNLMNKVAGMITTINTDAATLPGKVEGRFDRILMPHPSRADRYIGAALSLVADGGVIHYYRHLPAEHLDEAKSAILNELKDVQGLRNVEVRKVREVGPRWLEVVADLQVSRN